MQEVTIMPRKAYNSQGHKDALTIPLTAWDTMDPMLKVRFRIVSTASEATDEAAKKKRIDEHAKKVIAGTPPVEAVSYDSLLKEYKAVKKTDKVKAKVLLLKMQEISPEQPYVIAELNKLK